MTKVVVFLMVVIGLVFAFWAFDKIGQARAGAQVGTEPTPAQALIAEVTQVIPTDTPMPTATIGYMQTAVIAQQTSDEARRVNAAVTAGHEERLMEQARITAEADRQYQERLSWTATAALTSIPLTATQQAVLNTQIPMEQGLVAAQITATWGAPTQMVAIAEAQTDANFMKAEKGISLFAMGTIGFLALAVGVFLFRLPHEVETAEDEPGHEFPQPETVVIAKKTDSGGLNWKRYTVPVTKRQLTELAEYAVNGERTFAINRLEKDSRTLTRSALYDFRNWAVKNDLAFHPKPGSQEIVMNEEGICFLEGWFENHQLPEGYEFSPSPTDAVTPESHENTVKSFITM